MMFIGQLRRQLFIDGTHEWNGLVRDVTAECEQDYGMVSPELVTYVLSFVYRHRASMARYSL